MASTASGRPGLTFPLLLVLAAAAASAALLLWALGDRIFAAAFFAGVVALGVPVLFAARRAAPAPAAPAEPAADAALLRAALDSAACAAAITDIEGRPLAANRAWEEWFGSAGPLDLPFADRLRPALTAARRDGRANAAGLASGERTLAAELRLAGLAGSEVVWTFSRSFQSDLAGDARAIVEGDAGDRLGRAGVMAVVADAEGALLAANRAFLLRATGDADASAARPLVDLLAVGGQGQIQFAREGKNAGPLRLVQVPLAEGEDGPSLFLLLDELAGGFGPDGAANINALLEILPLGLALADRDGRFVYLNSAFRRAAGLSRDADPTWPGDLVVDEDKGAVSDSVRRFGRGGAMSGDLAVRLKASPEEPVALTVAGARGLGEAAVLLSLKDNSEEDRLKRQVAQATKMQAVGQLAGGVAHDFNNILTAIIGHCDLMLMRHTPGDSDYDDIQQIRSNSNRAAGLTRQLLAFSRQQTLRPQVLQLPDVIAEVSTLLRRLLGETVKLQVKHGRSWVRFVRIRDSSSRSSSTSPSTAATPMLAKDPMGGGLLTIQTYSVPAEDVRRMGSEILPIADYTALRVTDTGTGIPPHLLSKIFEPFFTTKEVGKGTGLGLSTVYGIVKQSGGFIFAESTEGEGTSFVIYLPVHRAEAAKPARKARETTGELWGHRHHPPRSRTKRPSARRERALTRHGYTVLLAEERRGRHRDLVREKRVDLMVSDVVMPDMDGPDHARAARKLQPGPAHPLFISAMPRSSCAVHRSPRVAFLAKPFSVQKLAEAARDALGPEIIVSIPMQSISERRDRIPLRADRRGRASSR
jgi:two-component system cell cycle sensor histidine kinase/response regulator CckA